MAYTKIKKVIDDPRDKADKARATALTTAGAAIMKNLKNPVRVKEAFTTAKRINKKIGVRKTASLYRNNKKFRGAYNKSVVVPIVEAVATVLGIGIPSIIAVKKGAGADSESVTNITKMVQQGDIDPSDLFQYLKTATPRESKILLAVLDNIGYDGSDVSTFVGAYRKSRRK